MIKLTNIKQTGNTCVFNLINDNIRQPHAVTEKMACCYLEDIINQNTCMASLLQLV